MKKSLKFLILRVCIVVVICAVALFHTDSYTAEQSIIRYVTKNKIEYWIICDRSLNKIYVEGTGTKNAQRVSFQVLFKRDYFSWKENQSIIDANSHRCLISKNDFRSLTGYEFFQLTELRLQKYNLVFAKTIDKSFLLKKNRVDQWSIAD